MDTLVRIAAVWIALLPIAQAAETAPSAAVQPRQYIYMLHLAPRLRVEAAWTDADRAAVAAHFDRLKRATEEGSVILAGRTREPLEATFGLVVFEAADDAAARAFMDGDPAVTSGVMTAELHPYAVALLRKAETAKAAP